MGWPWLRFEKFYEAHLKRKIIDELTQRKIAMVGALYSNPNYDGKENHDKRDQIIQRIEENFNDTVKKLYNKAYQVEEEKDELKDNPFFAASERGLKEQGVPELKEFLEEEYEVDQHG